MNEKILQLDHSIFAFFDGGSSPIFYKKSENNKKKQ